MKIKILSLISPTTLFCMLAAGCNSNSLDPQTEGIQSSDESQQSNFSQPIGPDISIIKTHLYDSANIIAGDTLPIEAVFSIAEAEEIDKSNLSAAIEYSTDVNFNTVYRSTVYDLDQQKLAGENAHRIVGRYTVPALPSGQYFARISVNPDWSLFVKNPPIFGDYLATSRHILELDYENNYGGSYSVNLTSDSLCTEDQFEPNNRFAEATFVSIDNQIKGSICVDDIDLLAFEVEQGNRISIAYSSGNQIGSDISYRLISPSYTSIGEKSTLRSGQSISYQALYSGLHYLALFGARTDYQLTFKLGLGQQNDGVSLFSDETIDGPHSWKYDNITLSKWNLQTETLTNAQVNCELQTTVYDADQPTAYSVPSRNTLAGEFVFMAEGVYTVNGESYSGWKVENGEISNQHWYENEYPGWAERTSDNSWRYWAKDGTAFIQCDVAY